MSLFKKYYQLILEEETREDRYRKSKGLKPLEKLSPYEQLEVYKDDPDIYISFRTLEKIGINPSSIYKTPNGIYTYPLSLLWYGQDFDHDEKQIEVPFAGNYPYIYVIRPNSNARILDLEKYNEIDYDRDIQKLLNSKLLKSKESIEDILKQIEEFHNQDNNYASKIWKITYYLTATIFSQDKTLIINNNSNLWNKILYKILGYDYVLDRGKGIIHAYEKTQAVFLSSNTYKVIKIINNKYNLNREDAENVWDGGEYPEIIWKTGLWKDGTFTGDVNVQAYFTPKKYKNPISDVKTWITGIWKKGIFKNAVWKNGIWKNGTFQNSFWWKGTWEKGKMIYSIWSDGIWKDGEFINSSWIKGIWEKGIHDCDNGKETAWEYGDWLDGTWKDGRWQSGIWHKGTWHKGTWMHGTWKDGTWKKGNFRDGTWEKGTWHDGEFRGGIWNSGTWKKGHWDFGHWNDGTWEDGTLNFIIWHKGDWLKGIWKGKKNYQGHTYKATWKNGTWHDGTWEDGTWEDGTWKKGTWIKGTWLGGKWLGGYDRNGDYHSKGDSPDKWKNIKQHWIDDAEKKDANYKIINDDKVIWYSGTWNHGTWNDGIWKDGTWSEGTWLGGEWKGGIWIGGYDKNGKYHGFDDSPDKWNI